MPRLAKRPSSTQVKEPAKTHSGNFWRYTFSINDADKKRLVRLAKEAGISEAEYCKSVVQNTLNGTATKQQNANDLAAQNVANLISKASQVKMTRGQFHLYRRLLDFLNNSNEWQTYSYSQLSVALNCSSSVASIAMEIFIDTDLIEVKRGAGAINKYRLPKSKSEGV